METIFAGFLFGLGFFVSGLLLFAVAVLLVTLSLIYGDIREERKEPQLSEANQ